MHMINFLDELYFTISLEFALQYFVNYKYVNNNVFLK